MAWTIAVTQDAEKKQIDIWQKSLGIKWTKDQFLENQGSNKRKTEVIIPLAAAINPEVVQQVKKNLEADANINMLEKDEFLQKNLQGYIDNMERDK